ncbi:hypothetical protein GSI_08736 [Ganoderma sinense ZZ0214-1]|uniref:Uncharacterized protein n=1 Tax=Ganoderma sinense ZZ0214-1 TaxID=1077348 RepID=A0A2G8S4J7_9APHY|nr:hypothetical protein GSI_08736 [Ganoderma sinense ZZ0214-1]
MKTPGPAEVVDLSVLTRTSPVPAHATCYLISLSQHVLALFVERPFEPFAVPMRFVDTKTGQFVEKDPGEVVYAILSHTWDKGNGEQTYKELEKIQQRYGPGRGSQAPQTHCPSDHQGCTSSLAERDRGGPSTTLSPSLLPNGSPSVIRRTLTTLGCLIQSEVGALRAFVEAYGLTTLAPAPAPSDPSPRAPDPPSQPPPQSIWDDPELSPKIRHACRVARENGFRYIWIDSCCIDKSSSAELSEAINSMYRWYALSDVCYAYLADVPPGEDIHSRYSRFCSSRWFTRGWTLQELIAPISVEFLSADWAPIGSKHTLADLVETITKIQYTALLNLESLDSFSVAQRFSWSEKRQTTRVEDLAYSLLGIFDVNMQLLYGEGSRAFRRLQEQIMQRIPLADQSLFAWGHVYLGPQFHPRGPRDDQIQPGQRIIFKGDAIGRSIFAPEPSFFRRSRDIRHIRLPASLHHEIVYTFTSYGIRAQFQMIPLTDNLISAIFPYGKIELSLPVLDGRTSWYLAVLGCEHVNRPGHLLGHVCYIPFPESGLEVVYAGTVSDDTTYHGAMYDLFSLSPELIESCRPDIRLKTVYIRHTSRYRRLSVIPYRPPTPVKLVLLRQTCDVLRSRGYSPDFRDPDPDHPATHCLTLSKHEHAITIKIQHTFHSHPRYGSWYTTYLEAEVTLSTRPLDRGQGDSAAQSGSDRAHTLSWSQGIGRSGRPKRLGHYDVKLSAAGAWPVTVTLGVDFVGMLVFILHVDVLSDAPPASPVGELAVDQA